MTRRTGIFAMLAVVGQILNNDKAEANQSLTFRTFQPPKDLTVMLGGDYGYERFTFRHGDEAVTFTAAELMAALKLER